MCDRTHSYVWHDSFICVTCLIHMRDKTHSYVWHDSCICVTWPIHMCDKPYSCVWRGSFTPHTCHWLILHMPCVLPQGYPRAAFTSVTWLIHMRDVTRSEKKITSKIPARCIPVVSSAAFVCLIWLIHVCDMAHSHLWHESFTPVTWLNLRVPYECHVCYLRYTRVLHSHLWHDSFMSVTRHSRKKKVYYYLRNTCTLHSRSEPCGICVCDMTHSCVTWLIHTCQKSVSSKCEN